MNGHNLGNLWNAPPSKELAHALSMLLRDLFLRAPAELLASLAHDHGPAENVYQVREEHNPLIGICYAPSLIDEAPFLANVLPHQFLQKWEEVTSVRRKEYDEKESKRAEDSNYRLYHRPFRLRYEFYTQPEYAIDLATRLTYPGDYETSVYFRTEDLDGDVGWHWPLRIGVLPDDASAQLLAELKSHVDDNKDWMGSLVDLVRLDSETDNCDLLLIPASIQAASETIFNLGIRIAADCVVAVGPTIDNHVDLASIIEIFRDNISTAGIGIAPVDASLREWFITLIRELSHNEPIDVALFSACRDAGTQSPFLAASRKLIEFSKLAESIKSIGEELLKAPPSAQPIPIERDDAEVFGIQPRDYHPKEIGEIFRSHTDKFMFDQERRSGARSAHVTRSAKRSMRQSEKTEKPEPRFIQAAVYDISAETDPQPKLENAVRAGATHTAVVRIGRSEEGWLQNVEEFAPSLPDKKTHTLIVIFTEPQLFNEPQVSSITLPPEGNSTPCEFTFWVPEDVEKIEARISIVYRNRVLQTALLMADVVAEPADTNGEHKIRIIPEAIVRADFSGLNERRNFEGAFILNHDATNAPGLTAIKDRYVSFSSLGELDAFVKQVDQFMTQVADYPAEYAGKLDTPATVSLLCDLAKHGRILYRALAESPHGNMTEIFSALTPTTGPKVTQRIQIISAKSDTRLPMEFLYDRKAPANSNAKLCPNAVEALKQDGCVKDCAGQKEPDKHVCPMGFWGLSKIIERHTYKTDYTETTVNGNFRFQSEPVEGRKRLEIFREVLFGASNKADKIEVRSGETVSVEPGGISKVLSVLKTVTNSKFQKVTSWDDWRNKINSAPSPAALLLLTHTEKSGSVPALEIEEGVLVEMQSIEEDYVYLKREFSPPVVFLIGCETGASDVEFMNFVAQFRRGGAALIVSTGAPIRGRHAVPVTVELLKQLKEYSDKPAVSFGQVMRLVKQSMLADGFPMVLTLMTYGDADWQIGTSKQ